MVKLYSNEGAAPPQLPVLEITKLNQAAKLPALYDPDSIGLDVFAFLLTESGRATSRAIHLKNVTEVPTGIKVHPPPGYYVQISSRLSLARRGIVVANAPAMIPQHFDGELTILLFNGGYQTEYIAHEHRIAQLTIHPILACTVQLRVPTTEHPEDVHTRSRQSYC